MTKYLFCVHGTANGDLKPCLAISRELAARGHRVTIATHANFRETVTHQEFDFIELLPAMDMDAGRKWFERATKSNVAEWRYFFQDLTFPHIEHNVKRLCANPDFDVLLCTTGCFAGPVTAEKLGKPWVAITFQPMAFGAEFSRSLCLGRTWRSDFLWRLTLPALCARAMRYLTLVVAEMWMRPVSRARKALDLPRHRKGFLLESLRYSPHINFALFSELFEISKDDIPYPSAQTGFVQDRQDGRPVSDRVLDFLDRGEEPVLLSLGGFGFVTGDGRDLFENAVKACRSIGKRMIFLTGGHRRSPTESRRGGHDIIVSEYEPIPKLLPRVSLFAHMGGIGSVGDGLRGGKPQLVLPFSYEQCDNALRLEKLGVSRTLPVASCSASALAREMKRLGSGAYRRAAEEAKARVANEDGATTVADRLEEIFGMDAAATTCPLRPGSRNSTSARRTQAR